MEQESTRRFQSLVIPVNCDLQMDLNPLERRLAWTQHFMAQHLPGTQQVRQLMGHAHFGARVVFGDCIFFTISPNEQHSALVLRLSRFRANDPYLKYEEDLVRKLAGQNFPHLEATALDLPEYDLRRAATARDPFATVEGYRTEIYLRLAAVLGIRMCPQCPRCNESGLGCQDRFGSNMRPVGGALGGITALGGATEYQNYGTPHFHGEAHMINAYQFGTMHEIAEKFRAKKITLAQWKQYTTRLHYEDVFDAAEHAAFLPKANEEFFDRFQSREHDGMSVVPEYLQEDAQMQSRSDTRTVSSPGLSLQEQNALKEDAAKFKKRYNCDLQFVFSRVQHHCHKRTKTGFVPLTACRPKSAKKKNKACMVKCKAGFPKTNLCTNEALLLCRGLAKRFGFRISGRRNAFGSMIGKRRYA